MTNPQKSRKSLYISNPIISLSCSFKPELIVLQTYEMYELYKHLSTDVATSNLSAAKEISDDVGGDQYRNFLEP